MKGKLFIPDEEHVFVEGRADFKCALCQREKLFHKEGAIKPETLSFRKLNPLMSGLSALELFKDCHELSFDCPLCRNRMTIYVHFNNGDAEPERNIWKMEVPEGGRWDDVTISPSIMTHHIKRTPTGDIRCSVHFSVTKGKIV